jgi:hypothetical protein
MSAGKSSAVAAVASELGCAAAHTPAAAESQGDLLRSELDGELALFGDQPIAPPIKRGPGRPAGSPNRTTLQLQALLRARGYRDPAEFLASIVSMSLADLEKVLGNDCEPIEALKLQRQAAADLMPYFHTRMPQAVEFKAPEARPLVVISMGAATADVRAAEDGTFSLNVQPNQQLTVEATVEPAAQSHDAQSHESE